MPGLQGNSGCPAFFSPGPDEEADKVILQGLAQTTLHHLQTNYAEQSSTQLVLKHWMAKWEDLSREDEAVAALSEENKAIFLDVLNQQRQWLLDKNRNDHHIDEEVIRRHLQRIDLEEEKIRLL